MEEIEPELGVKPLALVPDARGSSLGATERSHAAFIEGLRHLQTALRSTDAPSEPRPVILITSAVPEEGKTTIAVALAKLLALRGTNTVIVDCDLRRPSVHKLLGCRVGPGLSELLRGQAALEDTLRSDAQSGVTVLPAGGPTSDPNFLLGSRTLPMLVAKLRSHFDAVIIDSAPVIPISDTRLICSLADRTVMVARWGSGCRETTQLALRQLVEAGAKIAGVAITRVPARRHATYAYADSCLYARIANRYYQRRAA